MYELGPKVNALRSMNVGVYALLNNILVPAWSMLNIRLLVFLSPCCIVMGCT